MQHLVYLYNQQSVALIVINLKTSADWLPHSVLYQWAAVIVFVMRFVFAVAVEVEDTGIVDFGGVIHDTGQLVAVMEYAQVVYLADMTVLLPATALHMLDIAVGNICWTVKAIAQSLHAQSSQTVVQQETILVLWS